MKSKNKKYSSYGLLYGFCKSAKSVVGWLSILPEGKSGRYGQYEIVDDEDQATKFKKPLKEDKRNWSPERICKFINEEDELADWKFHVVWRKFKD